MDKRSLSDPQYPSAMVGSLGQAGGRAGAAVVVVVAPETQLSRRERLTEIDFSEASG